MGLNDCGKVTNVDMFTKRDEYTKKASDENMIICKNIFHEPYKFRMSEKCSDEIGWGKLRNKCSNPLLYNERECIRGGNKWKNNKCFVGLDKKLCEFNNKFKSKLECEADMRWVSKNSQNFKKRGSGSCV